MPTIRTVAEIVAAASVASAAYTDDHIAECYAVVEGGGDHGDSEATYDSLAVYILAEILESCRDAAVNRSVGFDAVPGETDPVAMVLARLGRAAVTIQSAIAALRQL